MLLTTVAFGAGGAKTVQVDWVALDTTGITNTSGGVASATFTFDGVSTVTQIGATSSIARVGGANLDISPGSGANINIRGSAANTDVWRWDLQIIVATIT